ncbi:MAG: hypothetical protein AAFV07_19935 [Bacteroidota bacterium]
MPWMQQRYVVLGLLMLILLTLLFLPIPVPNQYVGIGILYPRQSWSLRQNPNGSLQGTLYNHETGQIISSESYRFERGDVARFRLSSHAIAGSTLQRGDTIGQIRSLNLDQELLTLRNQLSIASARLRDVSAGDKLPLREEAEAALAFARKQTDLRQINYNRQRELFEAGAIATQVFNEVETAYQLAQIQVQVAQKRLEALQIGKKPERIAAVNQEISALEREIDFLYQKQEGYFIVAPITGNILAGNDSNLVIQCIDTSQMFLRIPVPLLEAERLGSRQQITLETMEGLELKQPDWQTQIDYIKGQPVKWLRVRVPPIHKERIAGMPVSCRIKGPSIPLQQYMGESVLAF